MADEYLHGAESRLLDRHGLGSRTATRRFLAKLDEIKPDIILLHNIHGYYLNYPLLFDYLDKTGIPVVWVLHDCWPITGHCAYFTYSGCDQWQTGCGKCLHRDSYPASICSSRSAANYDLKLKSFTKCKALTVVPVSEWLASIVRKSFLGKYPVKVIHNGIDLTLFHAQQSKTNAFEKYGAPYCVLGVNSVWEPRKGLSDFLYLRQMLDERYLIVLVGLKKQQIASLPPGIIGIERTNSVRELADYYASATVFVNPTYEDNFPTTNLEALACGTPVVTYQTGGSPESVIEGITGRVVEYGHRESLAKTIVDLAETGQYETMRTSCRAYAERAFNKHDRYREYLTLFESMLDNTL